MFVYLGSIQEVTFCSPPLPTKMTENDICLKLAGWCFFVFFFGVFSTTFYGHPVGDSAISLLQKKIENPKIGDTWLFVFPYSKPFGAHATSNAYKYFFKKLFYGHPVGAMEVTLTCKKI